VIIDENTVEKKVDNFIKENNLKQLNKDPHRQVAKTNPTNTSKMQSTSGQMDTQIPSKYKAYSPNTEHIHKDAQRQ